MNKKELLKEMEDALSEMGIQVKYETITGDGGYCKYKDKECIILNRVLPISARVSALKSILKDILSKREDVFIKPVVRDSIYGDENDQNSQ